MPLTLASLAALVFLSCSDDTVAPRRSPSPTSSSWTWLNPLPQGNSLLAVWGSSGRDVYAVGGRGAIVYFDGTRWTAMPSGTTEQLWDIMGRSSSRIWAVGSEGTVLFNDGGGWSEKSIGTSRTLYSVWANKNGKVFIGCSGGVVLENDGWSWFVLNPGGIPVNYLDVWAGEDGTVFSAGYYVSPDDQSFFGGQVWVNRYDGASWSTNTWLVDWGVDLCAIWGSSSRDVYFVGSYMGLHYDGEKLNDFYAGQGELFGMSGISASDMFAVGADGLIQRYDGSAWHAMDSGTKTVLHGVWGSSGSDVYAVGDGGLIQHFDGSAWTTSAGQAATRLNANDVWGLSGTDVYAVGASGLVAHYDGSAWTRLDAGTSMQLNGVWASSSTDVFAVGNGGTIVHGDGATFGPLPSPTALDLWDVHGTSSTNVYAVVGGPSSGNVIHYDGVQWNVVLNSSVPLFSVWAVSPIEVYAVGPNVVYSFDGSQWTKSSVPVRNGIWARGTKDIFVMGHSGIYHFDGTAWTLYDPPQQASLTRYEFTGIWGCGQDIYAVGPYSDVVHCDGSNWDVLGSPSIRLRAVWGTCTGDVIFAGEGGDMLRYRAPK